MNASTTHNAENEKKLVEYMNLEIGISRMRLNIQAFIGLFIFGWLMKMNYDDLKQSGFGWALLIAMAFLFAIGRQVEPNAFFLVAVIYIAAWIHTNVILSNKQNAAKKKYLTRDAKRDDVDSTSTIEDDAATKSE